VKPCSKTAVEGALRSKGFRESGGDHRRYRLYRDGLKTPIATKTSHGPNATLSVGLLKQMLGQMRLRADEFDRFVDCTLTGEDYIALLVRRGDLLPM
jgi:hypothetical protein